MQEYTLSDNARLALIEHHRAFQAAVAVIANNTVGREVLAPQGIGKYQGGVVVNGLEIAIFRDCVREDLRRLGATLPEEIAVAAAIEKIAGAFQERGPSVFAPFRPMAERMPGDPLRSALLDFAPAA